VGEVPTLLKELHRRAHQSPLLTKVHAGSGTSITIARARPHLDNRKYVAFARDDVQLAEATAKIPIQYFKPLGTQELCRDVLGSLTDQLTLSSTSAWRGHFKDGSFLSLPCRDPCRRWRGWRRFRRRLQHTNLSVVDLRPIQIAVYASFCVDAKTASKPLDTDVV
jgi:hypothetical protein